MKVTKLIREYVEEQVASVYAPAIKKLEDQQKEEAKEREAAKERISQIVEEAEAKAIMKAVASLPCPVAVSEPYAKDFDCGVLLSPPPLWTTLSDHLAPWKGRSIWLEAAMEGAEVTVTENGSIYTPCIYAPLDSSFHSETLHVDYQTELRKDSACFHLRRSRRCIEELLLEAKALGVENAIGLYQQFR